MKSNLSGKMLGVLAVVLLASSAIEGRFVNVCDLKTQLKAALNLGGQNPVTVGVTVAPGNVTENTTLPGNVTVAGNVNVTVPGNVNVTVPANATAPGNSTANLALIANIVCSVSRVSKFNTNLITTIQSPIKPSQGRPPKPGKPGRKPGRRPGGRRDHGRRPSGSKSSESSESSEENKPVVSTTKLFGIFQLSDKLACNSRSGPTQNICGLDCSALIDDDIRDDIACLKKLLTVGVSPIISANECGNVSPSQLFAGCV